MINKTTEGILYPLSYKLNIMDKKAPVLPTMITVPHKSWNYIEEELKTSFSEIAGCKPDFIFVFSFLRNGKIDFDDSFTIYTDSDCEINNPVLTKDDDICSEEASAEILTPFFKELFPKAKVYQFLTPEQNDNNKTFFDFLVKNYPSALFIISRNPLEVPVWPESLPD